MNTNARCSMIKPNLRNKASNFIKLSMSSELLCWEIMISRYALQKLSFKANLATVNRRNSVKCSVFFSIFRSKMRGRCSFPESGEYCKFCYAEYKLPWSSGYHHWLARQGSADRFTGRLSFFFQLYFRSGNIISIQSIL